MNRPILPASCPPYNTPFLNADGSINTQYWRFFASLAAQDIDVVTQAEFPSLTQMTPVGFIYVSDFGHLVYWDGSAPVFADSGNRFYVEGGAAPPASIGWHAADGSTVKVLNPDGTLSSVTTIAGAGIVGFQISLPGIGYAVNDTGQIGVGGATYKILTVNGSGAVETLQVTLPGAGYTVGTQYGCTTGGSQPGTGAGLALVVTALNLPANSWFRL